MSESHPTTPPPDREPPTLAQLTTRACEGDEQAFEELHRRLAGGLRRFLARRVGGSVQVLDELSQTAWVEVWRAMRDGRYDPERGRISTFLYAVGYKMVLRHFRDLQRNRETPEPMDGEGRAPSGVVERPDELLAWCESIDALRDCLHDDTTPHKLTDEERAVVAGVVAGETERALSNRLGIAASTVNARKKSAFEKLRKGLAAKGFERDVSERGPFGRE